MLADKLRKITQAALEGRRAKAERERRRQEDESESRRSRLEEDQRRFWPDIRELIEHRLEGAAARGDANAAFDLKDWKGANYPKDLYRCPITLEKLRSFCEENGLSALVKVDGTYVTTQCTLPFLIDHADAETFEGFTFSVEIGW